MAISRHDPEWQRVIASAALAGVKFNATGRPVRGSRLTEWEVIMPDGETFSASTKYNGARIAMQRLESKTGW